MVKRTNEEWRELLKAYSASGLTHARWCEENGINIYTFRNRMNRIKQSQKKQNTTKMQEISKQSKQHVKSHVR